MTFYRFWSTSVPPPPNPAGYPNGTRYAISAELLKNKKKRNTKAKKIKNNKANNQEQCNMDNPKSATWRPFEAL